MYGTLTVTRSYRTALRMRLEIFLFELCCPCAVGPRIQNTRRRKMARGGNGMRRLDGLRDCAIVDSRCGEVWTIRGPVHGGIQEIQRTRAGGGRESGGAGRNVGR